METQSDHERQMLGCGFLPPPAPRLALSVRPWDHPGRKLEDDETDEDGVILNPTCIGYLLQLPELREVTVARLHWTKGQLAIWAGERPTEALLQSVVILELATNAVEGYYATPASRGGGGPG